MIRPLHTSDIPSAMRLKEAAGWNQTEQDWANVLALEPQGCWVEEQGGEVVASTTAICYGQDLAWIGMVLVRPDHRSRGLARALMEHCLEWLTTRRIRQVKLDATDMGRPLYEKLGFRAERPIERWIAPRPVAQGHRVVCGGPAAFSPIASLDRETFGADRRRLIEQLLRAFPGQGIADPEGFILGRPGSNSYFLGPCAATTPEIARGLLVAMLDRTAAPSFFWDLFPDNPAAVALAQELGFKRRRELVRMSLHPESRIPGHPDQVFAAAGFEYG